MSGTGWWIADLWQGGQTVLLVSWIFWVIVSICLHELGHGFAAIWEGDDTPRRTGHMTWNPMVHIIGGYQGLLLTGTAPDWQAVGVSAAVAFFLCIAGWGAFRVLSPDLVDEL